MNETRTIPLGGRHNRPVSGEVLLDAADAEWLSQWNWCMARTGRGYAKRAEQVYVDGKPRHRTVYMHRMILGLAPEDPRQADHINGNGLDNRRVNLRVLTQRQNLQNQRPRRGKRTSTARGVHWSNRDQRWLAVVCTSDGHKHHRYLKTEAAAIAAAKELRRELMPYSTG